MYFCFSSPNYFIRQSLRCSLLYKSQYRAPAALAAVAAAPGLEWRCSSGVVSRAAAVLTTAPGRVRVRVRPQRSLSSRSAAGNRAEATESAMEVTGLKSMSCWKGHGEAVGSLLEVGHPPPWESGSEIGPLQKRLVSVFLERGR